jgi:hypothetical protein
MPLAVRQRWTKELQRTVWQWLKVIYQEARFDVAGSKSGGSVPVRSKFMQPLPSVSKYSCISEKVDVNILRSVRENS